MLDIQKNRHDFSEEIKKATESLKKSLEQHIADEVDKTLSRQLTTQFQDISQKVSTNFHEMFSPVLEKTKDDMQNLKEQGNSTLNAWKDMMLNYKDLWTKPFFIVFLTAIVTGVIVSLVTSFIMLRKQNETMKSYESTLSSYKDMVLWYWEKEKEKGPENKNTNKIENKLKNDNNKNKKNII